MQRTTVDGVPVLWDEGVGLLSARLVFGAGGRHETFRTIGVSHLVEHLVMGSMPRVPYDTNAMVGTDTTTFMADGSPDQVAEFLARVCAGLRSMPLDRIGIEGRVLQIEDSLPVHPAVAMSLGARFGMRGVGLLGEQGPGPTHLTAAHVQAHAAGQFVAENAVLVLTGPPPDGLALDLPSRTPLPPATAPRSALPLPGLLGGRAPYPVLSLELEADAPTVELLAGMLRDRLEDELRHRRGIAYECETDVLRLDATTLLTVWVETAPDHAADVAVTVWRCVRELAAGGPTDDELTLEIARTEFGLRDPGRLAGRLVEQAEAVLAGRPTTTVEEQLDLLRAISPAELGRLLTQALPTALFGLSDGLDPDKLAMPDLPDRSETERPSAEPGAGEPFRRRGMAPRDLRVVAGPAGIWLTARGHTAGGPWDDVVGVGTDDGVRELIVVTGQTLLVSGRHLQDADRLLAIIDEHTRDRAFPRHDDDESARRPRP